MRSSDIVDSLRDTAVRVRNSGEWGELADTLVDAAAEISRLRNERDAAKAELQRERLETIAELKKLAEFDAVTVKMIEQARPNKIEQEAILASIEFWKGDSVNSDAKKFVDALQSLLARHLLLFGNE